MKTVGAFPFGETRVVFSILENHRWIAIGIVSVIVLSMSAQPQLPGPTFFFLYFLSFLFFYIYSLIVVEVLVDLLVDLQL
jgi:hypothetical protein